MYAGCVASGGKGAETVLLEDTRHAWNAARTLEPEMQMQIEQMRVETIGNAYCDITLFIGSRLCESE